MSSGAMDRGEARGTSPYEATRLAGHPLLPALSHVAAREGAPSANDGIALCGHDEWDSLLAAERPRAMLPGGSGYAPSF